MLLTASILCEFAVNFLSPFGVFIVSLQVMYNDQNISGLLSWKSHLENYYG